MNASSCVACLLFLAACSSNGKEPSGSGGSSAGSANQAGGGASCTETADPGDTVAVPAGAFAMGCNDAVDHECADDEKPMHTVTLSAFEIDRTEVTQAMYTACQLAGNCQPPSCDWSCEHGDFPASCVTWQEANAYCSCRQALAHRG